ncbi:MAG: DNA polymerase III subunit [Candidatus Cloacimonetes bacterium]|nr:DNA polymerase III subunit [Candidatus Cloacimonadota bacterium]
MFRKILGQDQAVLQLRKAIENGRISQAYLFHGSDGVGKFMSALYFGMAINCYALPELRPCGVCESCHKFLSLEHPDLIYIFPTPNLNLSVDGEIKNPESLKQYQAFIKNKLEQPWAYFFFKENTEIRKESISLLIKRMELTIHEARYRIAIIEDADQMNTATANAFLKTLEEPPANTVIILITERLQMILPTILSRTQPLYFKPLSQSVIDGILVNQFEVSLSTARTAAKISAGNLKTAIRIVSDTKSVSREWAFDIVHLAAENDDLGYISLMDKYKEFQNKDQVLDMLKYLRIIAGDLACLKISPDSDITNVDKTDSMIALANRCKDLDANLHDFLIVLEDLNRKIEGNVNLNLILINLFIKTKHFLSAQAC